MYAKLNDGQLTVASKKVQYNGRTVFNPTEDILLALGYYPVTYTDMPTDAPSGQHYASHWDQGESEIVQVWSLEDDLTYTDAEPTMAELVAAIERGLNA